MEGPNNIPFDYRDVFIKIILFLGIVIIIYSIVWILVILNLIPAVVYTLFPQIILLLIGIFLVYFAVSKRNSY